MLAAGSRGQRTVEAVLGPDEVGDVGPPGRVRVVVERRPEAGDVVVGRPVDEPLDHEVLERRADGVQIGDLLARGGGDEGSLLRHLDDEPLGGERAQRLADRRPRDLERLDEIALDQPLPRAHPPLVDRPPELLHHLTPERSRAPGDRRARQRQSAALGLRCLHAVRVPCAHWPAGMPR
jgi:hypothetical protein